MAVTRCREAAPATAAPSGPPDGDADAAIELSLAETLAAGLPDAKLVVIPGAGHACHLERPDAFCLVVADFLADANQ